VIGEKVVGEDDEGSVEEGVDEGEEASDAMNVSSARRLVCRAMRAALEAV